MTDITVPLTDVPLRPGTKDYRNASVQALGLLVGESCNDLGHRIPSRKTPVGRHIRIRYDGFRIVFAPGETAGTSLSSGKDLFDLFNTRVQLNSKFLSSER
jgi:hypothetical protein